MYFRRDGYGMIGALILAGGRGERLGGVLKANIRVGGVRLIDRVMKRVSACRPIVVSHGRHDPLALDLPKGVLAVADFASGHAGPLAGFAAAIAALADEVDLLVCAAVDSPFLPVDYVERLTAGLAEAPAAIACYEGQAYPTNSIWRVEHFRELPAQVMAGTAPQSLKALSASAGGVSVGWPKQAEGDPFANINLPEDLARAEARALGSATGF